MAGMSVSTGLISGMDTGSLITQLMQIEANPQTMLKTRLNDTQADATAYRAVNTKFDALRTAAEALTKTAAWAAAKATSSAPTVTATAGADATPGSLTFNVTALAANHSVLSAGTWATTTTAFGLAAPLTVTKGGVTTSIALKSGATLADAVSAINASNTGLTATAVSTSTGYRLQVASTTTGESSAFSLASAGETTPQFKLLTQGTNAKIHVGDATTGYDAVSSTNTFSELMRGTPITVSQTGGPVTVSVASDPDAVATAVQTMVTAANAVLTSIKGYTSTAPGSTAVLKGDSTLRGLTSQVLDAVGYAIGKGSAATAGLQLTRDGALTFDKTVFVAKLQSDPALVQRLVNGTAASDVDGIAGNTDDVAAVPGVAQRLLALAKKATDTTGGTLTLLAKSQDAAASTLQDQIADWDTRLALRKDNLTKQFTAMETALGTLQNQASWLSSQISSLPSWSASNS
jgi:flagellar hook-associated protein 2